MKIYIIADHKSENKTILGVAQKWRESGHEVFVDMYYDRNRAEWCDFIFGEYLQGGVIEALKDPNLKKPIHARGIDIDLYFGHYLGADLNKLASLSFINDYMRELVVEQYEVNRGKLNIPIHTIFLGVELDKWTFKSRVPGKTIGWINRFWSGKGVQLLCQVMYNVIKKDPEYRFEIVGKTAEPWLEKYFQEFIKRNGFHSNVVRNHYVVSVNDWMNGIDYILSTSMKECMSLPIAEAMAKGIKPIIHNWWGADKLYPKELCYESPEEAYALISSPVYESEKYREFIANNYPQEKQINQLNKILNL